MTHYHITSVKNI